MKDRKHTEGPWEAVEPGGIGCGLRIFAGTEFIAFVGNSDLPDNTEPNARLIAAAPELLAALQAMLPILDNDGPLVRAYKDVGPIAESAIAKAIGK